MVSTKLSSPALLFPFLLLLLIVFVFVTSNADPISNRSKRSDFSGKVGEQEEEEEEGHVSSSDESSTKEGEQESSQAGNAVALMPPGNVASGFATIDFDMNVELERFNRDIYGPHYTSGRPQVYLFDVSLKKRWWNRYQKRAYIDKK